jgi:hypothetical protein
MKLINLRSLMIAVALIPQFSWADGIVVRSLSCGSESESTVTNSGYTTGLSLDSGSANTFTNNFLDKKTFLGAITEYFAVGSMVVSDSDYPVNINVPVTGDVHLKGTAAPGFNSKIAVGWYALDLTQNSSDHTKFTGQLKFFTNQSDATPVRSYSLPCSFTFECRYGTDCQFPSTN